MFYASRLGHRGYARAAEKQVQLHRGNRLIKKAWAISSQRAVYLLTFDSPQTPRRALLKMVILYSETESHLQEILDSQPFLSLELLHSPKRISFRHQRRHFVPAATGRCSFAVTT